MIVCARAIPVVGNTRQLNRQVQGMTLIELVIAVGIMAVITIGAYQVLQNLQQASARTEQLVEKLARYNRFWETLNADFAAVFPRSVRVAGESFGSPSEQNWVMQPTPLAGVEQMVQFSRSGALAQYQQKYVQSELRRVAYVFSDEQLLRLQWPSLDPLAQTLPKQQVLLDGIESLSFRYGYRPNSSLAETNAASLTTQAPAPIEVNWVDQWQYDPSFAGNTDVNLAAGQAGSLGQSNGNQATQVLSATQAQAQQQGMGLLPEFIEIQLESEHYGEIRRIFAIGAPFANEWYTLLQAGQQSANSNGQIGNSQDIGLDPNAAQSNGITPQELGLDESDAIDAPQAPNTNSASGVQ